MIRSPLRRSRGLRRTAFGPKAKSDSLLVLWGKVVKTRDKFTCQKCGRQAPQWKIDAAHILGRGAHSRMKYAPSNGISLCFVHHRWFDTHKGSHRDGEADRWVRQEIGADSYDALLLASAVAAPVDKEYARITLREMLARLEGKE